MKKKAIKDSQNNEFPYNICPVCGKTRFKYEFDICRICGWENDSLQNDEPDYDGGANEISLNDARENYKKFGATDLNTLEWLKVNKF